MKCKWVKIWNTQITLGHGLCVVITLLIRWRTSFFFSALPPSLTELGCDKASGFKLKIPRCLYWHTLSPSFSHFLLYFSIRAPLPRLSPYLRLHTCTGANKAGVCRKGLDSPVAWNWTLSLNSKCEESSHFFLLSHPDTISFCACVTQGHVEGSRTANARHAQPSVILRPFTSKYTINKNGWNLPPCPHHWVL